MKNSYIKLLIFEIFICIIFFLNSFVWNILSKHIMNLFLIIIIIIFRFFFGFEKDRHRYIKDMLLEVTIFLMIFFILYYVLGIFTSFVKIGNYYNLNGLVHFIGPTFLLVILREYLRYQVMIKIQENRFLTIISVFVFILLDITNAIYYTNFVSYYAFFLFFSLTLIPSISNNIVFSYITLKVGYKPLIFYSLVMSLYFYIIPIVPNFSDYLVSIVNFIIPIIFGYRVYLFFQKDRDEIVFRDYQNHHYGVIIFSFLFLIILVSFTSGYFYYWAIAVASGSMSPVINKGDVVLIEKMHHYNKINEGDILAFQYDNVTIIHRVVHIIKVHGKYYFYTKGDANDREDDFTVEESMIVGIVNIKIPFIGLPTVFVHEL